MYLIPAIGTNDLFSDQISLSIYSDYLDQMIVCGEYEI